MTNPLKILLAVISLFLSSCDQDPFGNSTRDIIAPYRLMQWEDGKTFYLEGPSNLATEAYGAIEGTVGKIGWNDNFILVRQNESGSGRGWRVIDVKKQTISDFITDDGLDQDSRLKGITIMTAAEAWSKL